MLYWLIVLAVVAVFGWGAVKEGWRMSQLPNDLSDELRAKRKERARRHRRE